MRNYDMGEFGDLADYGEVNPLWGFVAGGALTGAAMTTLKALGSKWPTGGKNAGLLGGLVGLAASGIAMIFPSTRRAGYLGAVAAILTALPEVIRQWVLVPRGLGDVDDLSYYTSEFAAPETPALEILGVPQLGVPMPAPVQILQDGYPSSMGYMTAEFAGSGW